MSSCAPQICRCIKSWSRVDRVCTTLRSMAQFEPSVPRQGTGADRSVKAGAGSPASSSVTPASGWPSWNSSWPGRPTCSPPWTTHTASATARRSTASRPARASSATLHGERRDADDRRVSTQHQQIGENSDGPAPEPDLTRDEPVPPCRDGGEWNNGGLPGKWLPGGGTQEPGASSRRCGPGDGGPARHPDQQCRHRHRWSPPDQRRGVRAALCSELSRRVSTYLAACCRLSRTARWRGSSTFRRPDSSRSISATSC